MMGHSRDSSELSSRLEAVLQAYRNVVQNHRGSGQDRIGEAVPVDKRVQLP